MCFPASTAVAETPCPLQSPHACGAQLTYSWIHTRAFSSLGRPESYPPRGWATRYATNSARSGLRRSALLMPVWSMATRRKLASVECIEGTV